MLFLHKQTFYSWKLGAFLAAFSLQFREAVITNIPAFATRFHQICTILYQVPVADLGGAVGGNGPPCCCTKCTEM